MTHDPGQAGQPVGQPLAAPLVFALSEQGQTVAVAESLTGGMLCSALIEVPGASAVVRGGVVSYATDLKHRLLGVEAGLLSANGAVDPDVAAQMAHGVRERLGADWGVATTGVAGPDSQDGIPAGTVYIAIAGPLPAGIQRIDTQRDGAQVIGAQVIKLELAGDRMAVRVATTERAVAALLALVWPPPPGTDPPPTGMEHGDAAHR